MNLPANIISGNIKQVLPLGGGCIASVSKIVTDSNQAYLYKKYSSDKKGIARKEANGLSELSKPGVIRIPKVLYSDEQILITEFINSGNQNKSFFEDFGRSLAKLHKTYADKYGFYEDNFIGNSYQKNLPQTSDWCEFYFINRLTFQIKLAETNGLLTNELKKCFNLLEKNICRILYDENEKPSLLHGDLWSGNYIVDENGNACIIDPAVYYGNREADLAMTKLFGGFNKGFYESYNQEYPLSDGYLYRENIYKLYHLLNHLNLFGTGYYSQSLEIIKSYI